MKMIPDLESRLRSEAKQTGDFPSPHLRTRIMAEVSSLHAEQTMRKHSPWAGIAMGAVAILFMVLVGLHRLTTQVPGGAPVSAQIGSWHDVSERAAAVSNDLHTVIADPFAQELRALSVDAERATRFLGECLPL